MRRPPKAGNIAWVLLAFGRWNVLQFALLSYGRASVVWSSRYLDSVTLNLVLNCICLALLSGRRWPVQAVWAAIIVAGLSTQSGKAFSDSQRRLDIALREEINVRSFLAGGQFLLDASGTDPACRIPTRKS